jgi:anti-anti-sigma regulatory factor
MTIALLPDHAGDCTGSLRLALDEVWDEAVTIDLENIPYLSPQALIELAQFRRRRVDRPIVLQSPNMRVLRTLSSVGFDKLFTIERATATRRSAFDGGRLRAGARR